MCFKISGVTVQRRHYLCDCHHNFFVLVDLVREVLKDHVRTRVIDVCKIAGAFKLKLTFIPEVM